MGCCGSSEAVAPESEIPPPAWGQPVKVHIKKRSMFDADYDVMTEDGEKWMLLDAVGSFWDDGYRYYLKHRSTGQVGEDGKPTSTVLGAVDIKGDCDGFHFQVSGGGRDMDFGPYFDLWDGDIDWGVSSTRVTWATWSYARRAILYSDYEMTQQIGWLDVTGSGTWHEWEQEEVIYDTDADGNTHVRHEWHRHQDCQTHGFRYKFNIFNTPMLIKYAKTGGGLFSKATLNFTASNAFAPDVPLFTVTGDGNKNAHVETFPNSDPVSTILAAYAISCKLDPADFSRGAERMCGRHIPLGSSGGLSGFVGMPEAEFEQTYSYPAPVPEVFAQAAASYAVPLPASMPMMVAPQQPMMMAPQQPTPAPPPPPAATEGDDPKVQLAKVKSMLEDGLISEDDYEKKKQDILARM
jgi:hypothetical protein